jgi:hypothetical protein
MIKKQNYQAFSEFFLDNYFGRGFGSMTKTDIEILIFHTLQQFGDINNMSDFEVCRLLKIPESKVKRLRYESHIIYGNQSDKELKVRLYNYLSNARFLKDKGYIQFSIEDKFLRNWFYSKVKEINGFADTSHNSEIVKISNQTFSEVLEKLYKVNEGYQKFLQNGENVDKLEKLGFPTMEKFTEGIVKGAATINNIIGILQLVCAQ